MIDAWKRELSKECVQIVHSATEIKKNSSDPVCVCVEKKGGGGAIPAVAARSLPVWGGGGGGR